MNSPLDIQGIGRAALAKASGEAPAATKPTLFGPDGRTVSSSDPPAPPRLVDAKAQPIKRSIKAEDIEGLDPSVSQYLYARTADGKPATHGNDYRFFAHELDPAKMREVDPAVQYIGKTEPRPQVDTSASMIAAAERYAPGPRNRSERRRAKALARKGV